MKKNENGPGLILDRGVRCLVGTDLVRGSYFTPSLERNRSRLKESPLGHAHLSDRYSLLHVRDSVSRPVFLVFQNLNKIENGKKFKTE
jgi:hypothetical protein